CVCYAFFLSCYADRPDLHSFPTRRSSDLTGHRDRDIVDDDANRPKIGDVDRQLEFGLARIEVKVAQALWVVILIIIAQDLEAVRSEEHTSELQSRENLVCRLLLEKKKKVS